MTRKLRAGLVAITVLAAITGAQPDMASAAGDTEENAARAEQFKTEGDKAMRAERYTDAIDAYDKAFRLTGRGSELWVRLLNNRARALIELKRYSEALDQLEQFEKLAPGKLKDLVPDLADLLKEMRSHVATLQISSNVDGARVSVGGKVVGTTPLQNPLRLDAGKATVEMIADGYAPYRETIELRGGEVVSIQPWLEPQGPERRRKSPGKGPPTTREGNVRNPIAPRTPRAASVPGADAQPAARDTKGSLVPAFVALGAGAAGLTVGAVTGGISMWQVGELKRHCPENLCLVSDSEKADTARTLGHVSTGSLIVGGIGAAAGVVLLVLRPGGGKTSATPGQRAGGCGVTWSAGIGLGTVDVRGSFQ